MFILFINFGLAVYVISLEGNSTISNLLLYGTCPLLIIGGAVMFFYPLLAESNLFLLTLRGLQAACIILCIIDSRRAYPDQLGLLIALMLAPNLDISFHLARMLIAVAMAIVDPVKNYSGFVLLGLDSLDAVIEVVVFVWMRVRKRFKNRTFITLRVRTEVFLKELKIKRIPNRA